VVNARIRPLITVDRPFDMNGPPTVAGAVYFPGKSTAPHLRAIERQPMTTALVSLKGIVKRYVRGKQRVQVLHGIDLEIRAGEFLALMGPSGPGKTTLLNLIGGSCPC
jgi:ABC-type glutathione transport system ATPase component